MTRRLECCAAQHHPLMAPMRQHCVDVSTLPLLVWFTSLTSARQETSFLIPESLLLLTPANSSVTVVSMPLDRCLSHCPGCTCPTQVLSRGWPLLLVCVNMCSHIIECVQAPAHVPNAAFTLKT